MTRRRTLKALSAALQGRLSPETDWMELLEGANRALVTPRLQEALSAQELADSVPDDAAAFFELIEARNNERNTRLKAMTLEVIEALNGAGVTPTLLKGMALWAACRPMAAHYPRMMSDVDLLVAPQEEEAAIAALVARGFQIIERHPPDVHILAELGREGDVGILDLHRRPPGPPALVERFDPAVDTVEVIWPGASRQPKPAHQIYLICIHDMFHDGGFWRGGFDVRHLCDIAELTRTAAPVDWEALRRLLHTRLVRNAVFSQLVAAHRVAGASIPEDIERRAIPRIHYQRHIAQYCHPKSNFPLALAGIGLEVFNLRQHWPFLGAEGLTPAQLLWWLRQDRVYPSKI